MTAEHSFNSSLMRGVGTEVMKHSTLASARFHYHHLIVHSGEVQGGTSNTLVGD